MEKPSAHFDEPHEVVVDSSLSKAQKVEALDTLEQDARLLAEAPSEDMGGGERDKLHDVLIAKDTLPCRRWPMPTRPCCRTCDRDGSVIRRSTQSCSNRPSRHWTDGLVAAFAKSSAAA